MPEETNGASIKLEKELDLLKDFPVPTFDEWKEKVVADLKGAPYEKKLLTPTYEGITLQPIYTPEDIKNLPHLENTPGYQNYVRGTNPAGYVGKAWEISQELPYALAEDFNSALIRDLQRGQTAINFKLDTATIKGLDADYAAENEVGNGVSISGLNSFERALKDIDITKYPLHIDTGFSSFGIASIFKAYLVKNNIDIKSVSGFITADPIAYLAVYGKLPIPIDFAYDKMKITTEEFTFSGASVKTIGVSGLPYHNSGASAVQELAIVLSTASEYLSEMVNRGLDINTVARSTQFTFGIGTFYFMEIAKLRAARLLWCKIVESFGGNSEAQKMNIHARCSTYYQTKLDPYVNLLRTTTEAFSAVIGGVDSLTTNPFDETSGISDEFSRRIARNTQIILKEEAHLDSLIDPAGGSFFIESLTNEIIENSWKLFLQLEENGGVVKSLQSGFIQQEIEKIVVERNKDLGKRKSVMVGVNSYANTKEEKLPSKAPDHKTIYKKRAEYLQSFRTTGSQKKDISILEKLNSLLSTSSAEALQIAANAILDGATLGEVVKATRVNVTESFEVTPLRIHRASEMFEEVRETANSIKQKTGSPPKIFLANMGSVRQHKARADFARGFFEVGGFEIIYPDGFNSPEEAAKAAVNSGAVATVICSTDETYPELVAPVTKAIKNINSEMTVILAGYPQDQVEAHKEAGVDEFIFMGADVYKLLKKLMTKIGAVK